jgi:phosphoketolase
VIENESATGAPAPLADAEPQLLDAYWRAADYLPVGQIHLPANPPLREHMVDERPWHRAYTREHGEDPPQPRDWSWPGPRSERGAGAHAPAGDERT